MKTTKHIISSRCWIELCEYTTESTIGAFDLSLNYTERQADPYYSDTETSIDLDLEDLNNLLEFLTVTRNRIIGNNTPRATDGDTVPG